MDKRKDNIKRLVKSVKRMHKLAELRGPDIILQEERNFFLKIVSTMSIEDIVFAFKNFHSIETNEPFEDFEGFGS